jgi:hypothetical protein
MATPEGLSLEHHRDLSGSGRTPIVRNVLLALLCGVLLLALLNVFGQVPTTDTAETSVARLEVDAPKAVRGGLYFQARYRVEALQEIEDATVVLDPDWLEDITLNTVEPAPVGEASRNGRIALQLGRIPAGDEHILFLHYQVNPNALGRRSQDVELYDGERLLVSVDRDAIVWP